MFRNCSINPTKLTEETAKYLEILLNSRVNKNSKLLSGTYTIKLKNVFGLLEVTLTHTLDYHKKIHPVTGEVIDTYSVLVDTEQAQRGSFGVVTLLEGVLIHHSPDVFSFENHKKQILKAQALYDTENNKPIEIPRNEAKISRLIPHLHARTPDESPDGKYSTLILKQFLGTDAAKIIGNIKLLKSISTDQRLDVTINILFALQYQIHQFGVIHRDMKPSNIMINLRDNSVYIIDLGLSCFMPGEQKGVVDNYSQEIFVGSPGYMAPEVLLKTRHDLLSDIYSIGLVLLEFWGLLDRQVSYDALKLGKQIEDEKALLYVINSVKNNCEPALHNFGDLLRGDLNDEDAKAIYCLFLKLIAFDPESRISLNEAINQLEMIRLQRAMATVPLLNGKLMVNAHESAMRLREQLARLSASKYIEHRENIIASFKKEFTGFQNYSKSFDFFKRVLGIGCFSGINSGDDLLDLIERESEKFNLHLQQCELFVEKIATIFKMKQHPQLRESLRDIDISSLQSLDIKLKHLILKTKKRKVEFANIIEFNQRTATLLAEIKNSFYAKVKQKLTENADRVIEQFKAVQTIADLCNYEPPEGGKLAHFKKELSTALFVYINESLTLSALVAGDRSASIGRMNDVQRLLGIIKNAEDAQKLRGELSAYLAKLETGLFFRSNLRSKLQEVMDHNNCGKEETAKNRWFSLQ